MKKERREQRLGKLEKKRRKNIGMESLREGPEGNRKGMQQNRTKKLKPKRVYWRKRGKETAAESDVGRK